MKENMDISEMLEVLEKFDDSDYDVVTKLIPLVYHDSMVEYNQTFHFFDDNKDDLKFIIADIIFWFLVDNSKWSEEVDIEIINDLVYEYYRPL